MRITLLRSACSVFIGLLMASCAPSTLPPTLPLTLSPTLLPTLTPLKTENRSLVTEHRPLNTEHRLLNTEHCSPLAALSLDQIPSYITQPFIAPNLIHDAEHLDWVRKDDGHHGVDIGYYEMDGKPFTGTPVLAALEGAIAAVVHDRPPYGNMLVVETPFERIPPALVARQAIVTGDSLYSLYAHLQNLQALTIGQPVACGQPLAETGLTGFTSGPHLHFEMRWGPPGRAFASMAYYRADATPEEMSNYQTWRMTAVFHLFDPMELLKDEG